MPRRRSELDGRIHHEAGRIRFGSGHVVLEFDSDVRVSIPRCVQNVVQSIQGVCPELEFEHVWDRPCSNEGLRLSQYRFRVGQVGQPGVAALPRQ